MESSFPDMGTILGVSDEKGSGNKLSDCLRWWDPGIIQPSRNQFFRAGRNLSLAQLHSHFTGEHTEPQ